MIDTRYLIDPSGIIPEWIADNRDLYDPREEYVHADTVDLCDSFASLSHHSKDPEHHRLAVVASALADDRRCIGIRDRDGVRTWPLVE